MLIYILILLSIGVLLYVLIPRKRIPKVLNFPELHEVDCPVLKDFYVEICGYMTSDKVVVYEYPTYRKIRITNGDMELILMVDDFEKWVIVKDHKRVSYSTNIFFQTAVKMFECFKNYV